MGGDDGGTGGDTGGNKRASEIVGSPFASMPVLWLSNKEICSAEPSCSRAISAAARASASVGNWTYDSSRRVLSRKRSVGAERSIPAPSPTTHAHKAKHLYTSASVTTPSAVKLFCASTSSSPTKNNVTNSAATSWSVVAVMEVHRCVVGKEMESTLLGAVPLHERPSSPSGQLIVELRGLVALAPPEETEMLEDPP